MTEQTKEKGIKEVDVFVQDNDLIFQLREKGNGATWDCKVFSQLMPFGVREGAFLKSFTATYIPKSNQVKLDQEIKTLKEQLQQKEDGLSEAENFLYNISKNNTLWSGQYITSSDFAKEYFYRKQESLKKKE